MLLRTLFLLLTLGATSFGVIILEEEPMKIASQFQSEFDSLIRVQARDSLVDMLTGNFIYEDCRGKKHRQDEFVDIALETPISGKVVKAQNIQGQVVYTVSYRGERMKFLITWKKFAWKMEAAQELFC